MRSKSVGGVARQSNEFGESLYKTLFELSPNGILIGDANGKILSANTSASLILGYSKEELLRLRFHDLVPLELLPLVDKNIQRIINGENLQNEVYNVRKDGKKIFVDIRETRINLPNGDYGILVVSSDITLRKEAEEALHESEEMYRILVEKTNDGIIFAQDGLLIYGNPKLSK